MLITHGAADAVVRLEIVDQLRQLLPAAQVDIMPNAGHAPFRDDASTFNRRLASFADAIARAKA